MSGDDSCTNVPIRVCYSFHILLAHRKRCHQLPIGTIFMKNVIMLTDSRKSLPSIGNRHPFPLYYLVAHPPEDDGADPHHDIGQSGQRSSSMDVKLQDPRHVLRKVSHHSEVAVVVTAL